MADLFFVVLLAGETASSDMLEFSRARLAFFECPAAPEKLDTATFMAFLDNEDMIW